MRRLMFMLVLALGFPAALSAAPELPFDPATLHGFNLMEKVGVDWMNTPYREEDFALIKEFGFNYVRLPVDYRCYTVANQWLSFREDVLCDLDQAIAWGEKYGFAVVYFWAKKERVYADRMSALVASGMVLDEQRAGVFKSA